jgi:hypothetical protein
MKNPGTVALMSSNLLGVVFPQVGGGVSNRALARTYQTHLYKAPFVSVINISVIIRGIKYMQGN